MKVLPSDKIARGLAWRASDYKNPHLLRWGTGKYMASELSPDDYWESQFWNQLQMALGLEVENLLRWTQYIPSDIVQEVLAGTYPNNIEGILAQWLPKTVSGSRIALWESFLGIPSDVSQKESVRRASILNTMQNRGQSPTVKYLLGVVLKYVNQAVIIDQNALPNGLHNNSFIVRVIDPFTAPSTDNLLRADIDRLKPASLAYTVRYGETDWLLLSNRDWLTVGDVAWNTLNY